MKKANGILICFVEFLLLLFIIFSPIQLRSEIIDVVPVVTGLTMPVAVTHAGDGTGRLFISLQSGQILVYNGEQVLPEPFLTSSLLYPAAVSGDCLA